MLIHFWRKSYLSLSSGNPYSFYQYKRYFQETLHFNNDFAMKVQWNLSKADTLGTNIFVRFRQMLTLDRLCLWDFDQKADILGLNILSALGRCLL